MKLFKKSLVTLMVITLSVSMVACNSKDDKNQNTTETKTNKIEYITEITKENVEEIVIEYKEVLSYYNDLKNNLKILSDISKDPQLERDAITAKDSMKNGQTLLNNLQTKYKPLVDAKEILKKMYSVSLEMASSVVNDNSTYEKKLKEYDDLFKDFKKMMDEIRTDVEKVRGKSPTQEEVDPNIEKKQNKSDISKTDEKDDKSKSDKSNDKNDSADNKKNTNNTSKSSNNNSNKSNNGEQIISEKSNEFVPKVSSLNSSIRGEIKNAGYSAGASYKQSGGDSSNLQQVATQMFNDIEGDNPINSSQLSEARQIFINAFISAYNSN